MGLFDYPEELLKVDSIRIDVDSGIDFDWAIPEGADVLLITGFCYGSDADYAFIPVKSIEHFMDRCFPVNTDESADDYRTRVSAIPLVKAVLTAWHAGCRAIIVMKIGDRESVIDNAEGLDQVWSETYTRTEIALRSATQLDYIGLIMSAEADFDGYKKIATDTAALSISSDYTTLYPESQLFYSTTDMVVEKSDASGNWTTIDSSGYTVYTSPEAIVLDVADPVSTSFRITYYRIYDFLDLLSSKCAEAISYSGNIIQSVINAENLTVTNMVNNEILVRKTAWQNYYCRSGLGWVPNNDKFRFISVVTQTGIIRLVEEGYVFNAGLGPLVAGLMSQLDDDIAVNGRVISLVRLTETFSRTDADTLSSNGFIPMGHTVRARRWYTDEVVPLSDQNMAIRRSELQHTNTLRLARRVTMTVKRALVGQIGTSGTGIPNILAQVLKTYVNRGVLKKYDFKIGKSLNDPHKIQILLQLWPYFTTRIIEVSITAGPLKV